MKIKRLNDFTEEQRIDFIAQFDALWKPFMFPDFDEYGLRFNHECLNMVGGQIILYPLEYMELFVDVVTKNAIDSQDPVFLLGQVLSTKLDDVTPAIMAHFNATAIGNLAYCAQHAAGNDAKEIAEGVLNKYLDYFIKSPYKPFSE